MKISAILIATACLIGPCHAAGDPIGRALGTNRNQPEEDCSGPILKLSKRCIEQMQQEDEFCLPADAWHQLLDQSYVDQHVAEDWYAHHPTGENAAAMRKAIARTGENARIPICKE